MIIMISNIFALELTNNYVPEPCNMDGSEWSDMKTQRICVSELDVNNPPCDADCCFTIYYKDRWTGTSNNEYELFILDIVWNENYECQQCAINYLLHWYLEILKEKSIEDPSMTNRILSIESRQDDDKCDESGSGFDTWIYVYAPGDCVSDIHDICENDYNCCRTEYCIEMSYNSEYGHDIIVNAGAFSHFNENDLEFFPECPSHMTSCEPHCEDFDLEPTFCDIDCDHEVWIPSNFPIRGTFLCNNNPVCYADFDVYYEYRECECNGITYYDYQIDEIVPIGTVPPCCDLYNFRTEMLDKANEYVLLNGPHPLPQYVGDKISTYRTINVNCWQNNSGSIEQCDGAQACCWSILEIEKISDYGNANDYDINRINGNYIPDDCPPDCFAYCIEPVKIEDSRKSNKNMKKQTSQELDCKINPNPNYGSICFTIEGDYTGLIELIIFDNNGHVVYSINIHKKVQSIESNMQINNIQTGEYHYVINSIGSKLCSGTFSIIK